jgi:hypothetical protein
MNDVKPAVISELISLTENRITLPLAILRILLDGLSYSLLTALIKIYEIAITTTPDNFFIDVSG